MPFLPSSLPDAPHFLPDGAAKLLDTQFRLLREDMLNPIRGSISSLLSVLSQDWNSSNNNKFSKELKMIKNEYGDLHVYPDVEFVKITCDKKKGFAYTLRFTPPNKVRGTRNERDRKAYWEKSKSLLNGSLITLLLPNPDVKRKSNNSISSSTSKSISDMYSLYFGVIISRDENTLAKHVDYADIDVNFTDPSIYPIALDEISGSYKLIGSSIEKRLMIESTGVYFEAYYHILKTLQSTNPSSLPFKKYFAPDFDDPNNYNWVNGVNGNNVEVKPPLYARTPGFEFDLSVVCTNGNQNLKLNVANTSGHDEVAKKINKYCKLDETQGNYLYIESKKEFI